MDQENNPNPQPPSLPYASRSPRRRVTMLGSLKRQTRNWFTIDKMRELGTTLALVVPLTLLIWVWAEREQTVRSEKMLFIVDVKSADPTKTMSIVRDGTTSESVTVELSGPRPGLDAIKEAISKDPASTRLIVDVTESLEPNLDAYTIPIGSRLNQQKLFETNGVTVVGTEPTTARILVDRIVERELEIKLPSDLASRVKSAEFDPKTVKVRGPERLMTQLEQSGELKAELDLGTKSEIMNARPSTEFSVGRERIRPIRGTGVSLDFNQIRSGKLLLSQEERSLIRSMAIYVAKPAGRESQFSVTVAPLTLTNIQVIGPKDVLEKLANDEIQNKPYALLTITTFDFGKIDQTRLPTFQQLPPGVEVDMQSVTPIRFSVTGADAVNDGHPIP